jgi:hypothetical protein
MEDHSQAVFLWACGCTFSAETKPLSFEESFDPTKSITVIEQKCPDHMFKEEYGYAFPGSAWNLEGEDSAASSCTLMNEDEESMPPAKSAPFCSDSLTPISGEAVRSSSTDMLQAESTEVTMKEAEIETEKMNVEALGENLPDKGRDESLMERGA